MIAFKNIYKAISGIFFYHIGEDYLNKEKRAELIAPSYKFGKTLVNLKVGHLSMVISQKILVNFYIIYDKVCLNCMPNS